MTTAARLDPKALTPMQAAVLGHIYVTVRDQGCQPTLRSICKHFGFRSPQAARHHLLALEHNGWVELAVSAGRRGAYRALRLLYRPDGLPFEGFADRPPLEVEIATHAPRSRRGAQARSTPKED
jgi:SOS-response transcriptional repressor LexA